MSGFVKTYGCSFDYVLNELSYQNLLMYSKVIPSYIPKEEREEMEKQEQKALSKNEYNDLITKLSRH